MAQAPPTTRKACASCGHDLEELCCRTHCPRCGAAQPESACDPLGPPAGAPPEGGRLLKVLIAIALVLLLRWAFFGPLPYFP